MKELIAKIRGAKPEEKCRLVAEAYEQLEDSIAAVEKRMESITLEKIGEHVDKFHADLDEMEEVLAELENLLNGLDFKEIKRIKENLEKDYTECLELGKFYEWLNPDGKSYTGDYAEFTGQKFSIPTATEIQAKLKSTHLKLYQKMEKEGLEPKLQITPIAMKIRTLGKKIDAKRAELKINTVDTFVLGEIKEEELQYAPTAIKAVKRGTEIEITGGKNKSQWIKDNGGFLIDIIPTKENLEADEKIQKDQTGQINYSGLQADQYAAKSRQDGFTPMSYESYLLAQMRAIKIEKPIETSTFSLLLDSNLRNSQYLAYGLWNDVRVRLSRLDSDGQSDRVRVRSSVRVL